MECTGHYDIFSERREENRTAWSEKLRILLVEDAPNKGRACGLSRPHARPTQVASTETTPALQDNDVYHMQQQQQLHNIQMPQQQMSSLEYFVNFNAGGGGFNPVQATDASNSHPLMHLTDRSAEVTLHRASSSYTGTAARDFLSLTHNS
ncbi:hypothetical protein MPTK1_5g10220 [Marchantia polymorpha subsp. ruderalis]|uniref:Uncharacterized protein n=2 Tax=Marchantia polymorpha TaxID=3197 RepID=A0AAF6BGV0_MARPO|nr:hypothetical protein MARPO_0048s0051 [Marchantia polymorpha]BBN11234.1 hypothetical protein Mp_5g10220 [Marchantia polymorpha subsp. ruderalis]|eukprot:PTQ38937.1 hypothetical protein MARPO_0048s0051 [Marchantia polymorpha]